MGRRATTNTGIPWLYVTDDDRIIVATEYVAKFFDNVTTRTVQNWKNKGCPQEKHGWWDLQAVYNWKLVEDDGSFNEQRKLKADTLLQERKVALADHNYQVAIGEYLAREEVEREWAIRVLEVKTVLEGLASKIATEFTDADMRAVARRVMEREVRLMLEQYSREGRYTPGNRRDSKVDAARESIMETDRESDGEPMG